MRRGVIRDKYSALLSCERGKNQNEMQYIYVALLFASRFLVCRRLIIGNHGSGSHCLTIIRRRERNDRVQRRTSPSDTGAPALMTTSAGIHIPMTWTRNTSDG